MKNVIVLTNNEQKKFKFFWDLGMSQQDPRLCVRLVSTKIYSYHIFGINITDKKLIDHISSRDGIIIIVDIINDTIIENIKRILDNNINIPALLVYENNNNNHQHRLKKIIKSPRHKYYFYQINDSSTVYMENNNVESEYDVKSWFNDEIYKSNNNTNQQITSITIGLHEMANLFENTKLPIYMWDHYGRLRIVYYSIMTYGFIQTIDPNGWLCTNWRKYKTSIGHGHLWHYTLTRFWAHIINNLVKKYKNFNDLYINNPLIHNGQLFKEYYTDEILFSPYARNNWVDPNLKKITMS
ncbi:hypothetical protein QJ856_gp0933 [Tupanvirus deep ocean]|uniref:Uncharacterized protein n=2 Tax=Tupanvirus TaxID=2094720 RepID=A0AC62A7R5_9VIRU|nr:hypothetical protein QJ856_gp0933 [Tupanvirus deep ocean]QKU33824.1 hypothetical protein [Tupanvirus deep ocean]